MSREIITREADVCPTCGKTRDIQRTCATCKREFTIDEGEAFWLSSKGLALPRNCHPCRKLRAAVREARGDHKPLVVVR